jgi:hypothetical protein
LSLVDKEEDEEEEAAGEKLPLLVSSSGSNVGSNQVEEKEISRAPEKVIGDNYLKEQVRSGLISVLLSSQTSVPENGDSEEEIFAATGSPAVDGPLSGPPAQLPLPLTFDLPP